ncbi:MAG: CHAP domain-containing protein [Oscillospiraceae bacterium]|nr:CHAP domain-containing protein [Oscillospiraceae bacterium]
MKTIKYKPRLTAADIPDNDNKYYIRKADGGYSPCIKGSPTHAHLTALSNCVGWAIGRAMEILQTQTNLLPHLNAEDFYNNTTLEKGQTPKPGAVICWKQGKLWNGNDGAGHVAVVEKVISESEIITSESAYGGMAFYTKTRKKGNGNWGAGSSFEFMGFIYLPAECVPEEDTVIIPDEDVPTADKPAEYKVGDIVDFKGGVHYASSSADKPVGGVRTAGRARITAVAPTAKHKYHLIGEKGGSDVYGWVNSDTIGTATPSASIAVGDKVKMADGAPIYGTSDKFAGWVYSSVLYVRELSGDRVVVSTKPSGDVTGAVDKKYLTKI